jgi:hypothetical protein
MVDIQTVSIMLASASVIAGVVYYALQVRHQTKIRQTEHVMRLYSAWGSDEYREAAFIFFTTDWNKYKDEVEQSPLIELLDKPIFQVYTKINLFFEGIGILLHRGLIDVELVEDMFSNLIKDSYERVKPVVEGIRSRGKSQHYEWFEYLYNEIEKREQKLQQSKA